MPEIDIPDSAGSEPESRQTLEFGAGRRAGLAALLRLVRAHPERLPEYMARGAFYL
jgi:hypothetical protein